MKLDIYIITNKYGNARMTKRKPELARDEVAVNLSLLIPDENFKAPIFNASFAVEKDDLLSNEPVVVSSTRPRTALRESLADLVEVQALQPDHFQVRDDSDYDR